MLHRQHVWHVMWNLSTRRILIELIVLSALKNSPTLNRTHALFFFLFCFVFFIKAAFDLMAREFILFGWMSRVVWHLHSHMPIRHLWLLITSQPHGLQCSGSHTWLHPDYILPLASLIWLFMGQAALSIGSQNMSQMIGKHGLEQKQAMKTSMTPRHPAIVFQRRTFQITIALDTVCQISWLVARLQAYQFEELMAFVFIQLWLIQSAPVSATRNTGYPENLKKEKLLSC